MLHSIGKRRTSEELVDLLAACHDRIRTFLELAIAIGQRPEAPDAEVAEVSARVRRYFADALPLHVEDEEESVQPRLSGRSSELDAALERMGREHDEHLPALREVLAHTAALGDHPGDAGRRADLGRAAAALRAVLDPHLREEERVVFPAIREQLSADDRLAIVSELRARRRRE